jgi:nicotinate dehydrogenase subunit B
VRSAIEARTAVIRASAGALMLTGAEQRQFERACGACHHDGDGPVEIGQNIPLALGSKLHSDRPDNLVRVILDGIRDPASGELGYMPAFADSLDDAQIAAMAAWMRKRFAPGRDEWQGIDKVVTQIRAGLIAGQ